MRRRSQGPLAATAFTFLVAISASPCPGVERPSLLPSDIPGGTITRSARFEGTALWGYIDGGADVYLEYGFTGVLVQEVQWQGHHCKIDVYQMKSPEGAFGIYSISRHNCPRADSLGPFSCVTPHQVQIARGDFYISVVNDAGSDTEQALTLRIAKVLFVKAGDTSFTPPRLFTTPPLTPDGLVVMNGPLGIQNGFPDWQELFDGMKDFTVYLFRAPGNGGRLLVARIRFSREADKLLFYRRQHMKGPGKGTYKGVFRTSQELSPLEIQYLESGLDPSKTGPFIRALEGSKGPRGPR